MPVPTVGSSRSKFLSRYDDGAVQFPLRIMTKEEEAEIKAIQAAPPEDPYFYKLVSSLEDPAWLALARHHGATTRLLDVTKDLRAALYFACSEHPDDNGYVVVWVNPWNPERNRRQPVSHYADLFDAALGDMIPAYREADRETPGTLKTHSAALAESATGRTNIPFLFECDTALNVKMIAQRGVFVWRGDIGADMLQDLANVFVFEVPAQAKGSLIEELDFQQINRTSLHL